MTIRSEAGTGRLIQQYRDTNDAKVKEVIVKSHLRLVRHIAHSFANRGESLDDLVQVGCIGLLRAIERFDPSCGRFDTYAASLINGEIRHYLRDFGALVRPPRELYEMRKQVFDAIERCSRNGATPTLEEISAASGIPVEKIADVQALDAASFPLSLDESEESERNGCQLVDHKYKSFQLAQEDRIMLAQAIGRLRSVSREVIEFAFYQDLTQTEIAKHLGISQMQVSRRLNTALGELWKILNSRLW